MRLIFVGSGELGLPALRKLAPEICCVITAPDKPAGRGLRLVSTPVKTLAVSLNLPVIETSDINHPETLAVLKSFRPELILVASFGQMLKKEVLALPEKGVVNIHPSLLPRYRGAAPVERAILNLEKETGVTVMLVTQKMDAGPILAQEKTTVLPDEDAAALSRRLAEMGADLAAGAIRRLREGVARPVPQDENLATYASKITRADGQIDWKQDAAKIEAVVRAFVRWPRAYTLYGGRELIIYRAKATGRPAPLTAAPGAVLAADKSGIEVACGNGTILLTELQASGKKRLPAGEFIRGVRFTGDAVLG